LKILTHNNWLENKDYSSDLLRLTSSGILTYSWFASITHWSDEDCLDLLQYYGENERKHRKGWNNNMSLVTQEGKPGDVTWSLIYWKFQNFEKGVGIIIPFTLEPDERGILRATTDFYSIRKNAIVWSEKKEAIATAALREAILEGLYWRITSGFSWLKPGTEGIKHNRTLHRSSIRRYRLVALLDSPDIILRPDFDVHHLSGIKELIEDNKALSAADDRKFNLEIQHKSEHHRQHHSLGDNQFRNYRKPKQLKLDI
jgi:hypothetical protein